MKKSLWIVFFILATLVFAACEAAPATTAESEPATAEEEAAAAEEPAEEEAAAEESETMTETVEGGAADDVAMPGEGELPEVVPFEVEGDIISAGSSTVFPLTEAVAERFRDEGYEGSITIDSIGSGAGFERFCVAGETDISNASPSNSVWVQTPWPLSSTRRTTGPPM